MIGAPFQAPGSAYMPPASQNERSTRAAARAQLDPPAYIFAPWPFVRP